MKLSYNKLGYNELPVLTKRFFYYVHSQFHAYYIIQLGYNELVGLPCLARDFYCQVCLYVSLCLCLSISVSPLYLSISPKPILTFKMPACWPAYPPLSLPSSHPPTSLFPDKKFPVVEAHFWWDKLFYIIEDYSYNKQTWLVQSMFVTTEFDCI